MSIDYFLKVNLLKLLKLIITKEIKQCISIIKLSQVNKFAMNVTQLCLFLSEKNKNKK